MAEYGVLI